MKRIRIPALLVLILGLAQASVLPEVRQGDSRSNPAYRFREPDAAWVKTAMAKLTLREKIGQLIQVRAAGRFINRNSPPFQELADAVRRNHIGGITLFAGDVYESAMLMNELQRMSTLPLFVAADFERGVSFRITDTTSFPWNMAVGASGSEEFAYREGAVTAQEARALGVHWIFAPVMDVNNNPDNPVINIRSYGEDPGLVARLGSAFIKGARDNGVMTTAKHFPGHGDTATDSHIGLAVIQSDKARLDAVEMVPFRSAVAAGVDSIMTAHVAVPKVTGETDIPATLSPKILTDLLRGDLRFQGLVVTDALEMGGITNRYWTGLACIKALQAGADMLLLPLDTDVAINEVMRAVQLGAIDEARIDASVTRILTYKTRLNLHKDRTVALENIEEIVATPENQKLAQEMSDRSVTLLKDDAHILPLNPLSPPKIYSLVLSSDLDTSPAAAFQAEMRKRFPTARTDAVDSRIPGDLAERILRNAGEAEVIVCATLVRVVSGKGNIAIPDSQRALLDKIIGSRKPVIWIAFGNPYQFKLYPDVSAYLCTFGYSDGAYIAAAKALSGEIAITGKTPVTIPGYFKFGAGMEVPRLDMTLKRSIPAEGTGDVFAETRKLLDSYVAARAFPGAALVVGSKGSLVLDAAAGRLDYEAGSASVDGDTIYDLASLSKVIGTTSAAMMLVESGRLLLDAPVPDYLPEFKGADKENLGPEKARVKVIHLLQHSSGLPAWLPIYKEIQGHDEVMKRIYATPLEAAPGTRTLYSDLGMILLGEILTRASGRTLTNIWTSASFNPWG